LRDERHIVIRPACAEDAAGLTDLYDTLDADDKYRRFFASYRPRPEFFVEMATVADRGGARLVAVLHGPKEDRIIGEAGYTLVPNGDGELAMVVDPRWRGWLGPFLLDALVETAAAKGIPNLEADVLTVNRPMLGLLRARGSVVMDHDDWTVVRLLIGTSTRRPTWPGGHDQMRVLTEGVAGRWHAAHEARAAGIQVVGCPGPQGGPRDCPALSGEPCPLAADADVIVVSHPPDDARWRELLEAHADLHPGVPVCLEPGGFAVDDELHVTACPVARERDVVSFVARLASPVPSASTMQS
jgi:GNAT superfamily N-acetyltransferase